jgi:putative hydrolase of the HAD superfamily
MRPLSFVFDLDDTLYLERDYVQSGFREAGLWAAKHLGIPDFADRARKCFNQGSRSRVFDEVLLAAGYEPQPGLVADLVSIYRTHRPEISLSLDAERCLQSLIGRAQCALITDGPLESQRSKVRALGLETKMRPIVYTAEWGTGYCKPDPRSFRYVEEAQESRALRLVYVGDNPAKDFAGPKALGWITVRVRRREGLHYLAPNSQFATPDLEISDLFGLETAVATLSCSA